MHKKRLNGVIKYMMLGILIVGCGSVILTAWGEARAKLLESEGTIDFLSIFKSINWLEALSAALVGSAALLSILVSTFPALRDNEFFQALFNPRHEKVNLLETLEQLGYSHTESEAILTQAKYRDTGPRAGDDKDCEEALLQIIGNYTTCYAKALAYGKEQSNYYIHTMEAVHDPKCRSDLAVILRTLIEKEKPFDFMLAPKQGNSWLAMELGKLIGKPVLLAKTNDSKSYAQCSENHEANLKINYEGSWDVLEKVMPAGRKLRGIVIDCNTSGGTQILNLIENFNYLVTNSTAESRIQRITEAFVLFRADQASEIDSTFSHIGYTVHRYFDLNEETKKSISDSVRSCGSRWDRTQTRHQQEIRRILNLIHDNQNGGRAN